MKPGRISSEGPAPQRRKGRRRQRHGLSLSSGIVIAALVIAANFLVALGAMVTDGASAQTAPAWRLDDAAVGDASALDAQDQDAEAGVTDGGEDANVALPLSSAGNETDGGGSADGGSGEVAADELSLPPVPPDSTSKPLFFDTPAREVPPVPPEQRPTLLIKTIIGLVTLLGLAYLGGHPRVQGWEREIGISQVITAGFPFVALGVIARHPSVGILDDTVLAKLSPVFRIGLGWIGFVIGFRFDAKMLEKLPRGVASFVAAGTTLTFTVIVGACGLLLLGSTEAARAGFTNPVFLRDALILGTAGALTSLTAPRLLAERGGDPGSVALVSRVVQLQELTGILGLLFIAAYFRPQGSAVTWQLPGTAWLLLTLGLGTTVGVVVYGVLLLEPRGRAEPMVLILGSIAFAAGIASYLLLSPVVVCFVAGFILVNLPGPYKDSLRATLEQLERPIYLLFLLLVGSLWEIRNPRGWLLMVAFVAARFAGKWLSARPRLETKDARLSPDARKTLVIAPMGVLSIAIVVNAQLLYPGGSISLIVTAIVGGAIVTELLVQLFTRGGPARRSAPPSGAPDPGVAGEEG